MSGGMDEAELRALMVEYGRSLFARGYGCGTSGNLSAKLADGTILLTPTGASLGTLVPERLTHLSSAGEHLSGAKGTKESWLHLAFYKARPDAGAVVHLHSTHAVALSCLEHDDPANVLPPITPYSVMRCGKTAEFPYFRPGDTSFAAQMEQAARDHRSLLLANHGPVVAAKDLPAAIAAAEEFEETARLYFILRGQPYRQLTEAQVADLTATFGE